MIGILLPGSCIRMSKLSLVNYSVLFYFYPSSIRGLDAFCTTFLHSCLFSTNLSSAFIASPVQVLMLSIHLISGVALALPPGMSPCIISFSRLCSFFLIIRPKYISFLFLIDSSSCLSVSTSFSTHSFVIFSVRNTYLRPCHLVPSTRRVLAIDLVSFLHTSRSSSRHPLAPPDSSLTSCVSPPFTSSLVGLSSFFPRRMPTSYPYPSLLLASHGLRKSSSVLLPSVSATKLLLLVRSRSVSTRLFSSVSKRPLACFSRSTFRRYQFSSPFLLSLFISRNYTVSPERSSHHLLDTSFQMLLFYFVVFPYGSAFASVSGRRPH